MNVIINLLTSSFVCHGFPDFYTFKSLNDLSIYLSISMCYLYIFHLSPSMGMLGFITASMYHFGQDFKYFNQSEWSGVLLISSSTFFHIDAWEEELKYLDVDETMLIILFISLLPGFIGSLEKPTGILIALAIGCFGPVGLYFYQCLIHAPLGVYRFGKGYILWGITTLTMMTILPYIQLEHWLVDVSISIVMSHIVAISVWQKTHKHVDNVINKIYNV